jgi:3-hydroxyacyl-CoA dehydrogenase
MGSGIAAHLANLGFSVTLLDVSQQAVVQGFERARLARPPHFYVPDRAQDVRLGDINDNLAWVAEADWVCEAVVENLEAKRALYAAIEPVLRPTAMITTNTSGLPIRDLAYGFSESFRRRFMGTHFFNPPRYLKLLELIPTPDTDTAVAVEMRRFLEDHVARRVVVAKDTPGFIANRFGMWSMFQAVHVAERLRLSVEEVDAITGPIIGRPRSGSFRLNDIVGLDVMRDIAANLILRCPEDPYRKALELPTSVYNLLARGWTGEKSGHGYYQREGRELLALDLTTFVYRQKRDVVIPSLTALAPLPLPERLRAALELRDEVGEYLRSYLVPTLRYADYLKQEVSHSVRDFDHVMMWGFGWEMGPFAMIDAIGPEKLGIPSTGPNYQNREVRSFDGTYSLPAVEPDYLPLQAYPILEERETLRLRDLGDGIAAVALKTKMGVINPLVVADLTQLLSTHTMDRFVLTSEGSTFSAGYDLNFFLSAILEGRYEDIDLALLGLQKVGELLESRQAVAAVRGHCLGAGLELALSCAHILANAETQIGLPESRVGLLPGGRGTTLMRLNNQSTVRRLSEVAVTLTEGAISGSADHARVLGYLRPTDVTSYHPDRLIADAKRLALTAQVQMKPVWTVAEGPLTGMIDRAQSMAISRGEMTEYDDVIGNKVKLIFAKTASYDEALVKERFEFIDLCKRALTQARIKHMLETKKPLRN